MFDGVSVPALAQLVSSVCEAGKGADACINFCADLLDLLSISRGGIAVGGGAPNDGRGSVGRNGLATAGNACV